MSSHSQSLNPGRFRRIVTASALILTTGVVAGPMIGIRPAAAATLPPARSVVMPWNSESTQPVVDEAHGHIFVVSNGVLQVANLEGDLIGADLVIDERFSVGSIALSSDGATLYVSQTSVLLTISTSTLTVTGSYSWACGYASLIVTDTSLWCVGGNEIDKVTLDGGTATLTPYSFAADGFANAQFALAKSAPIVAVEQPDPNGALATYDISGATPVLIKRVAVSGWAADLSVSADGTFVYRLCASQTCAEQRDATTLTVSQSYAVSGAADSLALSPDGTRIAVGSQNTAASGTDVRVFTPGPGTVVAAFDLSSAATPVVGTLAPVNLLTKRVGWSADSNRVYATATDGNSGSYESMLDVVSRPHAVVTLTARNAYIGGSAVLSGTVALSSGAPAAGASVTLTYTSTKSALTQLGVVTTDSSGRFQAQLPSRGTPEGFLVTASYAGTAGSLASSAQRYVAYHTMPYDFTGDGTADLVAGSPGEDLGTIADAGDVTVLPSGANGVSGSGSVSWSQDSTGIAGTPEAGDEMGFAEASGDFNGDGYADLAVSAAGEDTGAYTKGSHDGLVHILFGSATGLTAAHSLAIGPYYGDDYEGNGFAGYSLAAGDLTGDGLDDLVVGVPGNARASVLTGSQRDGISMPAYGEVSPSSPAGAFAGDFGWSVAVGDINGDGIGDVAVGAPWDPDGLTYLEGSVTTFISPTPGGNVLPMSDYTYVKKQRWTKNTTGVPGAPTKYGATDDADEFGWSVALGDIDGDGDADLAIGSPGTPVTNTAKHEDAGVVYVVKGSATGLTATGITELTQDSTGVPGSPTKNDDFGTALAFGDTNGDGRDDLAVATGGEQSVTVLNGTTAGVSTSGIVRWTQESTGIPGGTESGDGWGLSLRFEYFKGSRYAGIAVGAPGENGNSGAVTVIYGSASGLTGTGALTVTQDTTGVPGSSESGDEFGWL